MGYWSYGLVREDGKELKISEIYFNKNGKPWGYSDIWPNHKAGIKNFILETLWFILSIPGMLKDIYFQLKYSHIFNTDDIKLNKPDWELK